MCVMYVQAPLLTFISTRYLTREKKSRVWSSKTLKSAQVLARKLLVRRRAIVRHIGNSQAATRSYRNRLNADVCVTHANTTT